MKTQHFFCYLAVLAVLFTACKKDKNETPVTPVISVTAVTLHTNQLKLAPGDTTTLIATVQPDDATNKAVIWESSNPEVATVTNNGFVTALTEGKTTITVTTDDGHKTATCSITVKEPEFFVVEFDTCINLSTQQMSGLEQYYKEFPIDINQDGIDDIVLYPVNQSLSTNAYLYFKSCNDSCFIVKDNYHYIYYGDIIDNDLNWIGGVTSTFLFAYPIEKEQFIAIKLLQDDGVHYGWVSVKTKESSIPNSVGVYPYYIIEKYAYCKVADKAITAGQIE